MTRELKAAILIWKRGGDIDTFLHSRLASQGYEIEPLQQRYSA